MQNQPAPVEAPSEIAAPPGSMTFLRKSLGRGVESVPGGMVVPPANLNVGEASVVAGPSFLNRPVTSAPVAPGSQAGLDNLAAATQAVGRAGYDANQGTARFTQAQRDTNAAGNARLQRGFMSPREREDTLTAERRAFDRGFIGDKLTAAQEIEKTKAGSEVGVAKERAEAEKFTAGKEAETRMKAMELGAFNEPPKAGRFRETYSGGVLDTATGQVQDRPVNLDAYNSSYESKKGAGFLTKAPNVSDANKAILDKEWSQTGLPLERAPHRGGRGLDFDTPEEVDSLLLPRGTRITIRGRPAVVE
jgi:hypothetical protein